MGSNTEGDIRHLKSTPTKTHLFLSLSKVVAGLNLSHGDYLTCTVWLAE